MGMGGLGLNQPIKSLVTSYSDPWLYAQCNALDTYLVISKKAALGMM